MIQRQRKAPPCKHCHETRTAFRRRKLCFACYQTPKIRTEYGAYVPDFTGPAKKPRPIKSLPGTALHIKALQTRARNGHELRSVHDRRLAPNLK